jgi:RNA polymerase sigma-70 factor (ECF subfamily)
MLWALQRPEPASAVDDAALIRGTLAGRREDFDALVERHQKPLYAFVYRFVRDHEQAADIVQVSFLQAYSHLAQFAGHASFKTWLHQIALNQCRALRRAARARPHVALEDVSEARFNEACRSAAGPSSSHARVAGESAVEWKPVLERLLARLPPRQRAVVMLRIFSDLPFKDIARIEGISENAAKVNYHHAIIHLRQWLKQEA